MTSMDSDTTARAHAASIRASPCRAPGGGEEKIDIRTLPFYRFEANEAHTEGVYGMVFAGNNQRGDPIDKTSEFAKIDRTGPDVRHPHIVRDVKIWQVHYGLRPQVPNLLLDRATIDHATYGIYRPALENHVYRDLTIVATTSEPFNRSMDDASTQFGRLTVDGLDFQDCPHDSHVPLIQISDNNPTGQAESHFRNVRRLDSKGASRRALVNRGGGTRVPPITDSGVPVYLHDYFGPGRTAKIASTTAADLKGDQAEWRKEPPLTGDESVVTEVKDILFPKLLDPVDDLAPTTMVTRTRVQGGRVFVSGISHDNGTIAAVVVNGQPATILSANAGVVDWEIALDAVPDGKLVASARDEAGNLEKTGHAIAAAVEPAHVAAR
jgi:hypothetical protein